VAAVAAGVPSQLPPFDFPASVACRSAEAGVVAAADCQGRVAVVPASRSAAGAATCRASGCAGSARRATGSCAAVAL